MSRSPRSASLLLNITYFLLAFPGITGSIFLSIAISLYRGQLVLNPLIIFLVAVIIVNVFVPRPLRKALKTIPKKWRFALWEMWKLSETKSAMRVSPFSEVKSSLRVSSSDRTKKF